MDETHILYQDYPVRDNEVRLCRFVDDSDYVSVEFQVFPVESLPRYQILSYVWSVDGLEPSRNWTVKINGTQLPILDTLWPFLQTLRAKKLLLDGSWWWIDSLCIDLTNTTERSLQVQMMQRLYSDCHSCIIWLGEESHSSGRAVDFIYYLHRISERGWHNIKELRTIMQEDEHQGSWVLLEDFLSRRWWTRVWTLQEFCMPSVVSFWVGSRSVGREEVCASLKMADICETTYFENSIPFRRGWNRRRIWKRHRVLSSTTKQHAGLSLPALAAYCCTNEATNDVDRLYGLYGLLSTDRELLRVDYSQTVDQIYFQFAKSFIEKHNALDLAIFASLFSSNETESLPSWVPDWRRQTSLGAQVIPLMVSQSGNASIGNLRPIATLYSTTPSARYSASGDRAATYKFEDTILCVRGMAIDRLDPSKTWVDVHEQGSKMSFGLPTVHTPYPIGDARNALTEICRSLILSRHDRYLRVEMPVTEFLNDFLVLCALSLSEPTAVNSKFLEWFNKARHFQIHGLTLESMVRQQMRESENVFHDVVPNQDHYIQDSFFGRWYDTIVRMALRLTITRNGRLGMIPEKAREDDLVCIIYGCSVPVLLRKARDDEAYTLVGECFIDQCMSGEVLQFDYTETTFQIR
ncbi:HET-domain-containing protein [Lophiostoma macrostomum CBS 122681]|uniref:HET-domain-containing protein n=1 Tax=Lophiostoma macrostomum CBS 122681 TaxID=1314788 RepID=A0A6A6TJ79_9PLEO|nr:HET-domain-containing protein [Lophiostoma macrostomum CBS 122681]